MKSSAAAIKTLIDQYPNNIKASFYKTPLLNEYLSRFLPGRLNEVFGTQHVKAYVFDNCLIMSG